MTYVLPKMLLFTLLYLQYFYSCCYTCNTSIQTIIPAIHIFKLLYIHYITIHSIHYIPIQHNTINPNTVHPLYSVYMNLPCTTWKTYTYHVLPVFQSKPIHSNPIHLFYLQYSTMYLFYTQFIHLDCYTYITPVYATIPPIHLFYATIHLFMLLYISLCYYTSNSSILPAIQYNTIQYSTIQLFYIQLTYLLCLAWKPYLCPVQSVTFTCNFAS